MKYEDTGLEDAAAIMSRIRLSGSWNPYSRLAAVLSNNLLSSLSIWSWHNFSISSWELHTSLSVILLAGPTNVVLTWDWVLIYCMHFLWNILIWSYDQHKNSPQAIGGVEVQLCIFQSTSSHESPKYRRHHQRPLYFEAIRWRGPGCSIIKSWHNEGMERIETIDTPNLPFNLAKVLRERTSSRYTS